MKRSLSLSIMFSLSAALIGCAADPTAPPDGDDDGSGGGGGGGDEPVPLSPAGKFNMQSEYDLSQNLPGTPGTVATYFIQATDDPDDPTKFIVDELIKALPEGNVKEYAQDAAPFITGYLNDRLLEVAPDFVTKIVNVGDAFGQVLKKFGTNELVELDASGHGTKTINGLHFKIDNVEMDFAFSDFSVDNTKVENLQGTLEQTGKLSFAEHKVPLKYGQVLRIALDQAVIPMVDPSASNLGDILHNAVNCEAVGQYVYEALDFGSPSTFENACTAGLTMVASALYHKLEDIDASALELTLTGVSRGVDRDKDGTMDEIVAGTYTGQTAWSGTPAPLGAAKFFGKKQ